MAEITLTGVNKVYPGGTHAVHDVDLSIADGEFMIMVGPSGCAKSTILRMIAGLEVPTAGTIEIGGRVVNDVPPKDRDIAMVFQSYALYPHMTVAENMAFGLRLRKMAPTEIEQRVNEAARILGLEQLLDRLPKQMSGGQRQRVAMGRAIVREPQAFLMDEPLSNLDAKLRVQMRTEIAKLHQRLGTTTVYVTHDQVEAMTLGQRICILRKGVVQQVDTPYMVYTNPANVFVGGFIGSPGMNFMSGHLLLHDGRVHLQLGEQHLPLPPSVTGRLLASSDINGRGVIVGIRPEHMHEARPGDGSACVLPVDVELTETMGSEAFAYFTSNVPQPDLSALSDTQSVSATFVAKLEGSTRVRAGEQAWLRLELEEIHLFDPQTQLTMLAPVEAGEQRSFDPVGAGGATQETPDVTQHAFAPRPVLHGYMSQPAAAVQPVINLHQTFSVPAHAATAQGPATSTYATAVHPHDVQLAGALPPAEAVVEVVQPNYAPAQAAAPPTPGRLTSPAAISDVFAGQPATGRLTGAVAGSGDAFPRPSFAHARTEASSPATSAEHGAEAARVPAPPPPTPPAASTSGSAGPAFHARVRASGDAPIPPEVTIGPGEPTPATPFAMPRLRPGALARPSELFQGRPLFGAPDVVENGVISDR